MHLVGLALFETQPFEVELHPAGLRMMRIEIDDGDDHVCPVRRGLAVADQLIIVDREERQQTVGL